MLTMARGPRPKSRKKIQRWIMGPEYNNLMDNMAFRISLNLALFAVWAVAAFALLKLA